MLLPDDLLDRAQRVVELFKERKLTLSLAESCTGGLIAACITSIAGSSAVLERGFVTYSNRAKQEEVFVTDQLLAAHGAVSEEVATAMAQGARQASGTHVALSVTGIAGPDGGTSTKPVGLVYLTLVIGQTVDARRFVFDGNRDAIRRQAVVKGLSMLVAAANDMES